MQDLIISKYLEKALVKGLEVNKLVETLFEQCYELPEQVAKERPSYLNFSKTIQWKGDVVNAHISSLSALNSQHGCFTECYRYIKNTLKQYPHGGGFRVTGIVPGFGNPVLKGQDPRCMKIEEAFNRLPSINTIPIKTLRDYVCNYISPTGNVRENLVFWNAAIAYTLGLSEHYAPLVFILATQLRYTNSITK